MNANTLSAHRAAAQSKQQAMLDDMDQARHAVSVIERELGSDDADLDRVEIVTTGEPGKTYAPAMHTWPAPIANDMLTVAREWMAAHPERELMATSCWVFPAETAQLYFALHIRTRRDVGAIP